MAAAGGQQSLQHAGAGLPVDRQRGVETVLLPVADRVRQDCEQEFAIVDPRVLRTARPPGEDTPLRRAEATALENTDGPRMHGQTPPARLAVQQVQQAVVG